MSNATIGTFSVPIKDLPTLPLRSVSLASLALPPPNDRPASLTDPTFKNDTAPSATKTSKSSSPSLNFSSAAFAELHRRRASTLANNKAPQIHTSASTSPPLPPKSKQEQILGPGVHMNATNISQPYSPQAYVPPFNSTRDPGSLAEASEDLWPLQTSHPRRTKFQVFNLKGAKRAERSEMGVGVSALTRFLKRMSATAVVHNPVHRKSEESTMKWRSVRVVRPGDRRHQHRHRQSQGNGDGVGIEGFSFFEDTESSSGDDGEEEDDDDDADDEGDGGEEISDDNGGGVVRYAEVETLTFRRPVVVEYDKGAKRVAMGLKEILQAGPPAAKEVEPDAKEGGKDEEIDMKEILEAGPEPVSLAEKGTEKAKMTATATTSAFDDGDVSPIEDGDVTSAQLESDAFLSELECDRPVKHEHEHDTTAEEEEALAQKIRDSILGGFSRTTSNDAAAKEKDMKPKPVLEGEHGQLSPLEPQPQSQPPRADEDESERIIAVSEIDASIVQDSTLGTPMSPSTSISTSTSTSYTKSPTAGDEPRKKGKKRKVAFGRTTPPDIVVGPDHKSLRELIVSTPYPFDGGDDDEAKAAGKL